MSKRQIILDTETTGLSPEAGHRLIEVGCLEMVNRRFTGRQLHYYLNPERAIDAEAIAVHGITDQQLKNQPLFQAISIDLWEFLQGAELIIHNAAFDLGFLNSEFGRLNKNYPLLTESCSVIDTLVLARQRHPGQANNLDALCKRYGVDNSDRQLHGALIDAKLLGLVYLAMTGGQLELFSSQQSSSSPHQTTASQPRQLSTVIATEGVVIEPSEAERIAHQAMLDTLRQQGGCLWNTD